ncbi:MULTISPECIES: hypothetical protein [Nocardioides]|uniref:hypothetical protein n=1 Tax=Nocardioides TaxID=1839 RepID=UPI0003313CFF|nr:MULTISPECIES: hypothetical protein [Nocardioides]EON23503.1 hypothetical protein CF8_2539 [Nocardioides sp. CF8]
MPLSAPITRIQHAVLRAAVIDFKESAPRGRAPVSVQVGAPGLAVARHVVERGQLLDQALRTDICAALLQRTGAAAPHRWAWLSRSGSLSLHDADVAWSAAWYAACAESEVDVPFVVVTRTGWRDPRSEVLREWSRLRRRSGAPGS